MIPNVLSIAGSDPSGGAGIQADIKAISANGAYAMAAITAFTVQNTQGVRDVHLVPPAFVADQIGAVLDDIRVDAIKIGMIATADIADAVADVLDQHPGIPIVLDPVMVAKGGASLLAPDAIASLAERLLPLASIVTPNLPELARLTDRNVPTTRDEIADAAQGLRSGGPAAVFAKGGHLTGPNSPDLVVAPDVTEWLETERIELRNTHGTGCTLSAALAAQLAHGHGLPQACRRAKAYVTRAIQTSDRLDVGRGIGPTNHFHQQVSGAPRTGSPRSGRASA